MSRGSAQEREESLAFTTNAALRLINRAVWREDGSVARVRSCSGATSVAEAKARVNS